MTEEKLLGWLKHWYAVSDAIEEEEEQQAYEKIEYIIKAYFDKGLDEYFRKSRANK